MKSGTFQKAASGVMADILHFSRKLTGRYVESINKMLFVRNCGVNVSQTEGNEKNPGKVIPLFPFVDGNCTIIPRDGHGTPNLTVVTAYWNLGTFQKGSSGNLHFSTNTYFQWASVFQYLVNPLVVYTDSKEFKVLMETLRSDHVQNTKIFLTNRTEYWPFQLTDKIQSVFDQPGYPKYSPNTVKPEYSAAQHAKYAVIAESVRKQIFNTSFYAWLDVGYFRDIVDRKEYFKLNIPPGFDSKRISFNQVSNQPMSMEPFTIFRDNIVWVGGGFFVASGDVILQFDQLYHKAVLHYLDLKLMNSDQQVLYSMYSVRGRETLKPEVELQLFIPTGDGNVWFYLGYLCRKEVIVLKS